MRVDRGRLNWGIFFIVLGAVPLAYQQGLVSSSAVGDAWRLWPLVIVGIGLAFVLSRTPAFFLGGTVVAICLGLVFGSALAIGPNVGCGDGGHNTVGVSQSGAFAGNSSVNLDLQCGSATVTTTSDSQWRVVANNSGGRLPQITSGPGLLSVTSANGKGWSFDRGKDDWQVGLPSGVPINLTASLDMGDAHFTLASANLATARFDLNLGSMHVDLTGAKVGTLNVSTNLGAAYVTLDGSSDLTGHLETNLGSLDVCLPANLGVRVTASDSLSSSDFSGSGLVKSGSAWQTPGYDGAAHKANLTFDTSLGSLKLHPAGGCK
jgi:hypothetical protein